MSDPLASVYVTDGVFLSAGAGCSSTATAARCAAPACQGLPRHAPSSTRRRRSSVSTPTSARDRGVRAGRVRGRGGQRRNRPRCGWSGHARDPGSGSPDLYYGPTPAGEVPGMTPRLWAVVAFGVLVVALVVTVVGAGAVAPAAGAPGRPARRAALAAGRPGRRGQGVPFGAAPGRLRQPADRAGRRAGARPDPARRAADRGGRPAVRRPLGGPGRSSAAFAVVARRRPAHPAVRGLAAHGRWSRYGLSTQGWGGWTVDLLKGYAVVGGDRRGGPARLLRDHPLRAALVVGLGRGRRGRARGAAVVRAAGAGRAGVQQVHPDGRRPAAHRADGSWPSATACRFATCWWPTRPGAPARSTPTSPASARPGASSSTTPCCARRRRPRWSASSRTSWATPRTTTCSPAR